jgi:ABC-type glutathione transport system ATPase component
MQDLNAPLVEVEGLTKRFRSHRKRGPGGREFTAVDRVSFTIRAGDALGIVGETGAGKSTVVRCLLGLETPSEGRIRLFGHDTRGLTARGWKAVRRHLQPVFQDPKGSMNPRWSVERIVGEPLVRLAGLPASEIAGRVRACLGAVGLGAEFLSRYRHQLSGGQQQRVNIARAISVEPRCIVLDEPVASLDASVKREIVMLLAELRRRDGPSYLLISHDLNVVRFLCSSVIVLFGGRIVEKGPTRTVTSEPRHPYTKELLAAQLFLPGDRRLLADRDGRGAWSLDNRESLPTVGDLVEVSKGHFVAQEAA